MIRSTLIQAVPRGVLTFLVPVVLFAVPGSVASAAAHQVGSVRVVVTATPVVASLRAKSEIVMSAPQGTVLEVLGKEGDWYWVLLPRDVYGPQRPGWVAARDVEIVPAGTPTAKGATVVPSSELESLRQQVERLRKQLADLKAPQVQPTTAAPPPTTAIQPTTITPEPIPGPTTFQPRSPRPGLARHGAWFSGGLGVGSLGCDECRGREDGASGGLAFGGTLNDRVLLGVGTTGFAKTVLGSTFSVGTLDARIRFYPSASSGFFLNGGIGLGSVSWAGESELGLGMMLGVGWDIRVGQNVSITPFWNGSAMRNSFVDANFGQLGIGITIH